MQKSQQKPLSRLECNELQPIEVNNFRSFNPWCFENYCYHSLYYSSNLLGLCICQPWPVCSAHNLLLALFKHPCKYTKLPHGFGTIPKRCNLTFITGSFSSGWEPCVFQNRRTETHEINMNPNAILTLLGLCQPFSNISYEISVLYTVCPTGWEGSTTHALDTVRN